MTAADVPITVVAGYLGAGKTTLINQMLHERDDADGLAILVNDFGDVNIDEELIRARSPDGRILGLANGCVCCSIGTDLADALERVRPYDLTGIVLEASGVASPGKLRAQCHYPGFVPERVVVLVDATAFDRQRTDKYVGNLVRQQVAEADEIIVTKTDLRADFVLPDDLDDKRIDPAAITGFVTRTLHQTRPIDAATLQRELDELPEWVARVKGFVETTDRGIVVAHRAGGSTHLEPATGAPPLRLVVIAPSDAAEHLDAALTHGARHHA